MEQERIHGLTLRQCVEIMAKDGALKAQYGERSYKPHLHQFLAARGTNENAFAHAWNGWHSRMESDPSGQLYAKFSTMQRECMQQAMFADVADASQDSKAGVSLEAYAEIMAGISAGKDYTMLLQKHGIQQAQWQQAQNEWTAAMAADVNHHLTTQYGQLYAKYTPGFQQNMEASTAAIMSGRYVERSMGLEPDEPEREYTLTDMVSELQSSSAQTRWTAAHHIMNQWDIAGEAGRQMPPLSQAIQRAYQLAHECLEQHDEFTVSDAQGLAEDLQMLAGEGFMSPSMASDSEGAIGRCLNRGRSHLQTLRAGFAPIANKAVPERVRMQSAIQDHESLVESLEEILEEWRDTYRAPEAAQPQGSSASPHTHASTPHAQASAPHASEMMPADSLKNHAFRTFLSELPFLGMWIDRVIRIFDRLR